MIYKTSLITLTMLGLLNCSSQKTADTTTNNTGGNTVSENTTSNQNSGMIYLKEGENKALENVKMNVTFKGISEDSRCPEGVQCVWAGVAVAEVELMGVATRPVTVSLATMNMPARNYSKSAIFNGYRIELKELGPAKVQNQKLSGSYKIGIAINKIADNQTDTENNPTDRTGSPTTK